MTTKNTIEEGKMVKITFVDGSKNKTFDQLFEKYGTHIHTDSRNIAHSFIEYSLLDQTDINTSFIEGTIERLTTTAIFLTVEYFEYSKSLNEWDSHTIIVLIPYGDILSITPIETFSLRVREE